MIKFTKNSFVDIEKYNERLHYNGYILYNRKKMEDSYFYENARCYTYAGLAKDIMGHKSQGFFYTLDKMPMYKYLTTFERCPEHYFKKKGVQGVSIDMKKVIDKLASNGYAQEFLEYYKIYRGYKSNCDTIRKLLSECYESKGKGHYGEDVTAIYYDVNQRQNLRFNYKDRDVVALPKSYANTFTVENGYFLVWGDFAQSDFRIAFNLLLRDKENTEFMSKIDDKYEGLARLIAKSENKEFNLEEFKQMRKMYKTMTLACMYGTRDSIEQSKKQFIDMLCKFLYTCPKYAEFEKRIKDRIELNLPFTIRSYFGHEEIISPTGYGGNPLDKALNTPIQSGTSEVVILTVNKILDTFYDMGYTEDDISVYMVRHDEPIFKVKECVKKDLWVFNQATDIIVDNWVPLRIDFSCGYYYKEEDVTLMKELEMCYMKNADKIDVFEVSDAIDEEYYPLSPVLHLSVHYEKLKDHTIVCFCNIEKDLVDTKIIKTVDDKIIMDFIYSKLCIIEEKAFNEKYFSVVIYNNYVDDEQFVNNRTFFKFIKMIGDAPAKAETIAQCIAYTRSIRLYGESTIRKPTQKDLNYVKSVNELNYLK